MGLRHSGTGDISDCCLLYFMQNFRICNKKFLTAEVTVFYISDIFHKLSNIAVLQNNLSFFIILLLFLSELCNNIKPHCKLISANLYFY